MARHTSLAAVFCAVTILATGCGKKSPTGPSPLGTAPIVNTFVGELKASGGAGGTLHLRAAGSLASAAPSSVFAFGARLLALIEPRLLAQGSTASGLLVTDAGVTVSLTGTFSGNTFSVSGGGYFITATVTNNSLSGSATVPGGGSAAVGTPAPPPVQSPPPATPSGTYVASYRFDIPSTYVNTLVSDGSVAISCTYTAVVTGDLSLEISNGANGDVAARLTNNWVETEGDRTCPFAVYGAPITPVSPSVTEYEGPAATLTFGRADQGPGQNGTGVVVRSESFVGAVSGTTVVARVSRSFRFTNSTSAAPPRNHVSGYPTVSATVTLAKR